RFSGKSSVVLAYPSLDDRGSLQAVAIVSLNLDTMAQVAAAAQLPPDSVFVMIDGQGNILLRNPDALQTQGKLYTNSVVRQAVLGATQHGAIEAPGIDGITRLYAYLPLSSTPAGSGYMIVGYPTSWIYGDADRLLERNLIGLAAVALLALAAAWVLGDALLLRQVRALVVTARRWTSGDLAARAHLEKGSTEILDLAAAYDEMADAVQQREDRLVQAEARYRNLVEQIPVVTYTAPPEHPLAFAYISPQVQDLLDLAPEALMDGRASFLNLVSAEDRRRVQQAVEGLRSGTDEIVLEYRLCPGGDRTVWVQHQARLLCDETGRPLLVQGLLQDITARKEAEQALTLRTLQLAHSNRELQDFVYIASHDLQEPLRKIQAFGERLRGMYQAQLAGKGSDYIDRMTGAAARMQTMINGLLAYSRVTTRSQPPAPVDLNQVLQEVISDLEVSIERNRGRVETSPLPPVLADPLQMHGLLQNLIGNALKFHRPGVDPVVRVSALPGGGEDYDGQDFVRIIVADNGIGFDEKYVDRIFQPFQRLHARTEFEGSGIGLAICRKIAEQYGGKITAASTPGEGAVFEVTLRACPADPGETV
ncbi:MAG TPA: ATP-binding protein, partial [Anaerolineaceae bacterium]